MSQWRVSWGKRGVVYPNMNNIPWLKQPKKHRYDKLSKRIYKRLDDDSYSYKVNKTRDKNNLYKMQLKLSPTKAEIIVGNYLYERKIGFQFQKGFFVPFHRIVDFYLPNKKIIIEVDGGYHKETVEKDKIKDTLWKSRDMTTIRVTNDEVFDGSFKAKLDIIPRKKKEWNMLNSY